MADKARSAISARTSSTPWPAQGLAVRHRQRLTSRRTALYTEDVLGYFKRPGRSVCARWPGAGNEPAQIQLFHLCRTARHTAAGSSLEHDTVWLSCSN